MGEHRDEEWLKKSISTALGWDAFVVEGVVQAINSAGSQKKVDDIVRDYMGGDKHVTKLVSQYLDALGGGRRGAAAAASSSSAASAATTAQASNAGSRSGFARTGQQRLEDLGAPEEQEVEGPEIVDGLKVKKAGKRAKDRSRAAAAKPKVDRPVANCLACGKVYDFRGTWSSDAAALVEAGGKCTFCGFHVALTPQDKSETRELRQADAAPDTSKSAPEAHAVPAAMPDSSAREAAAVEFKNRLVEADRNSARRTTVVDDQSDFFEIDGNAWLSEEERAALRARQKAIEEAEEARRKRVTVTVDLLGRQVLMADEAEDAAEAAAGGCRADAAAMATAALATAAEIPQGGVTSAAAAAAAASGIHGRSDLRITRNPNLSIQPMFVKPPLKAEAQGRSSSGCGREGTTSSSGQGRNASGEAAEAAGSRDRLGRRTPSQEPAQQQLQRPASQDARKPASGKFGGSAKRQERQKRPLRLQHDDPFVGASVETVYQ